MGYTLNFSAVWRSFDQLLWGLLLSLELAIGAILIGAVIGLVTAFGLISTSGWARRPAALYVTMIRNLPILVLILFSYFALPQMGVRLGKIESFVATLAIYSGAYLAEVFRAGLLSIPNGLKGGGPRHRSDADADPHLHRHTADVQKRASVAIVHADLAFQGHVSGRCHRRAGTHL